MVISHLSALEILDSRGRPTVAARCGLDGGEPSMASVPSGASTGKAEALELRDGDPLRYGGLGCRKAVGHVNEEIAGALVGEDVASQRQLDGLLLRLDGTSDKSRLGANALLAVSLAFARAVARATGVPLYRYYSSLLPQAEAAGMPRLPRPTINLFSGGKHAGGQVAIQDVLLLPLSAQSIDEALSITYAVYQQAVRQNSQRYDWRPLVADEGGLAPPFESAEAMLEQAVEAITAAGYRPGSDVALAVDLASSHFRTEDGYLLDGQLVSAGELIESIARWVVDYPIVSVEDGLAEEDWEYWPELRSRLRGRAATLGDDLLCTQPERIERAVRLDAADALLLKVNQVGTLSKAAQAQRLAREANWSVTVSARSGETEDDWLADLAVGWRAEHIKIGSITRSERLAKYNRLLAIEAETGWRLMEGGEARDG